jgi:hypothetical protein
MKPRQVAVVGAETQKSAIGLPGFVNIAYTPLLFIGSLCVFAVPGRCVD